MRRGIGLGGLVSLLLLGCIPLPIKVAGSIEGRFLDAASGAPIEAALVVIRFEGVYDDVLPEAGAFGPPGGPERPWGHFRAGPVLAPGFTVWPWLRTRALVATVLRDGYRCAEQRAFAVDLETGAWRRLDPSETRAACQRTRRIPASPLATVLRGYLKEIEATLNRAKRDPASAFSLHHLDSGDAHIETHDILGARRVFAAPCFPIATPLRRLDFPVVGDPMQGDTAPAQLEPLRQTRLAAPG